MAEGAWRSVSFQAYSRGKVPPRDQVTARRVHWGTLRPWGTLLRFSWGQRQPRAEYPLGEPRCSRRNAVRVRIAEPETTRRSLGKLSP